MTRRAAWPSIVVVCAGLAARDALADAMPAAGSGPAAQGVATAPIVRPRALFTADDLLLFEVSHRGVMLTEALGAFSSRAGVFLPLGEFARLLDLSIVVDPPQMRAEGWYLRENRRFMLDLGAGRAETDGRVVTFAANEAVLYEDEIYVRLDLMQKLLPLSLTADTGALALELVTREPFPFEQRVEREQRRRGLRPGAVEQQDALTVLDTPYELFTAPAFDANFTLGASSGASQHATSYEMRMAGDVLWSGMQVFAGSDDRGRLSNARVLLERRDADGGLFGALHATRASLGDTYTPSMPLGARSRGGRGFSISSEALEQASVFDRIDLRGELPQGYEVELYVNEVLRGSQSVATQGRYEFAQVPLVFGVNVVRLTFYGPRGERREEVRRINVGGGQLKPGQTTVSLGVVQQDTGAIRFGGRDDFSLMQSGRGDMQVAATVAHGFAGGTTASLGLSRFTPTAAAVRTVASASVGGSLRGFALRGDVGHDDTGGSGMSIAVAGRTFATSIVARHAEYRGGFIDEMQAAGSDPSAPLVRSTEIRADLTSRPFGIGAAVPIALRVIRDEQQGGRSSVSAGVQISTITRRLLLSSGLDYQRSVVPGASIDPRLVGSVDGSGFLFGSWHLRGGLSYDVAPTFELRGAGLTLDHNLSSRTALRFGVQHSFNGPDSTSVQGGLTARLGKVDLSLSAGFSTPDHVSQVLLRFSLGSLYDPLADRYRFVRPGAAAGGAVAVRTFVDRNGDGRWQTGDTPLAGVAADSIDGRATADEQGRLLVTGLGDGPRARVGIRTDSIDDPYLSLPSAGLQLKPRPGRVAVAEFALRPTGEVMVRVTLDDGASGGRGVSALGIELAAESGEVVGQGRTEYDGTVIVEGLPPGRYAVRLDRTQAERLRMRLVSPIMVTVPAAGGYAGEVAARITVDRQ